MTIDINSRQLRRVVYKDGSERVENFELHGVVQPIELPTSAISGEELQERINAAQSTQMAQ